MNANKTLFVLILASMLLAPAAAEMNVVATTTVLEDLVKQVGGDEVTVTSIVSSSICPGHWDLKPSQVNAIAEADLIVQHGIEGWLPPLEEGQRLEKLPGIWNTPQAASEKVQKIQAVLTEMDPENADLYQAGLEAFSAEMGEIEANLTGRAAEAGADQVKVLCMEWQTDFVSSLGFEVVQTYGSEETLSMKDVADLITAGKDEGVSIVVANLQSGTALGEQMANEIGAEYVILTNFPGAVEGTDTIQQMIRYNGEAMLAAV